MIKKSILFILGLLIFINSIGCFAVTETYKRDDIKKISEGDEITLMTIDNEVHTFTVVKISAKEIHGTKYIDRRQPASTIVILIENIKSIQVTKWNKNSYIALGVIIGGIIVLVATSDGIIPSQR